MVRDSAASWIQKSYIIQKKMKKVGWTNTETSWWNSNCEIPFCFCKREKICSGRNLPKKCKKKKKEKEKKHERTQKTGLVEFLKENPYVPTYVHIQLGQKKLNKKQFKIQWTQHLSKSPV